MSHSKTPINSLPNLDWSDIAREEIALSGEALIFQSQVAYQIGHVAIAGLVYGNFMDPPCFWFALAKGATIRDLIDFRRFKELIPHGAYTVINATEERSIRFAKLYDFEDTGQVQEIEGRPFMIFRRK